MDSPRTAGCAPDQLVMAAGAADVHTVVGDGRIVVSDGQHVLGDVGRLLSAAIEPLWEDA
jgi:cytosine/adenosine deaminase-related metal-dependent hydrolase